MKKKKIKKKKKIDNGGELTLENIEQAALRAMEMIGSKQEDALGSYYPHSYSSLLFEAYKKMIEDQKKYKQIVSSLDESLDESEHKGNK